MAETGKSIETRVKEIEDYSDVLYKHLSEHGDRLAELESFIRDVRYHIHRLMEPK